MTKSECRVGMIVEMMPEGVKAVVVKLNPKRARVRTIDQFKSGRGSSPGSIWNCPYMMLRPVVGEHSTVVMKSFEQPGNQGIKVYMSAAEKADLPLEDLDMTDDLIVRAIKEIYTKIDDATGEKRYDLSHKINALFTAIGREVSQKAAEEWISRRSEPVESH
jgi:hypothetical protein